MKNKRLFKAIMSSFFAAVFVLSCGLTSFAARTILNNDNTKKEIGVYVKYVDNTEYNTVPTDKDGNGTVTLPDGTVVKVSDVDDSEGRLVVELITEKEALDWICGVTDDKVKNPQAYHIYYIDAKGNVKPAVGVTVTIKSDNLPEDAVVFSVDTDGKSIKLISSVKMSEITFTVNGEPYYVIGEKVTSYVPNEPNEPDSPDVPDEPNEPNLPDFSNGNPPKTGYDSHTVLWLSMLLVSSFSLIAIGSHGKKKNKLEK